MFGAYPLQVLLSRFSYVCLAGWLELLMDLSLWYPKIWQLTSMAIYVCFRNFAHSTIQGNYTFLLRSFFSFLNYSLYLIKFDATLINIHSKRLYTWLHIPSSTTVDNHTVFLSPHQQLIISITEPSQLTPLHPVLPDNG